MKSISTEECRALKTIAAAKSTGCTEHVLIACGFSLEFLAGLVRAGLADVSAERVGSGRTADVVCRMWVTDTGTCAVSECPCDWNMSRDRADAATAMHR
jgi:hypothetical protein